MGKTLASSRHEDITLNSMTQTREKWDSLALSRADSGMLGRCHGIPSFYFLFYCLEATVKKQQFDENDFCHGYGSYFKCAVLKVTWFQLCSQFFLNNYDAHWPRHLKDTLQLKILRTWINIHANSSLGKYHYMKMGEGALEIISCTKFRACSLKNIAPGHFTYYCIFFTFQANLVFKFNLVLTE